ncbi:MAG: cAMP-binding protein [Acidobacteria bacterium OLB17]|nr:MAG: cAMP-binding protein [Acidobacteria bacterium OLB17]MCZ2392146.1 Crp/Fnr family transcriptional regulator [Acidobacteriota bacterium]
MPKAKSVQRVKPILSIASDELKRVLAAYGHHRQYFPNEELFAVGENAEYLPIIISGRVKMVQFPDPGKEVIIGIFGAGEMFAVPPVVDGDVYPASAYALEESEILLLHRDDVFKLLAESPEFTLAVLNWMSSMLRQKTALIRTLAGGSAEQRIAGVLIRLFSASSDEPPLKIKLRREDIARMAGLTTETAIRTIRHLAAIGDIRIEKGKILIDSTDGLSAHLES